MLRKMMSSLSAIPLLVVSFSDVEGQTLDARSNLDDPAIAKTIRVKYVQSPEMPNGLAFLTLMQSLSDIGTEDDRVFALGSIRDGMGLSKSGSEEFLDQMLNASASYNAEYSKLIVRLACSPDEPLVGDEIYAMFEALDDASVAVAAQHLAVMKAELGQAAAARLDQWLEVWKLKVTHVFSRYKELYKESGADPAESLGTVCASLSAHKEGDQS